MVDPRGHVPPPLRADRDPGDAWVETAQGERFWGRFGAAGLLVHDAATDRVLLQHRAAWSHQGGTWGIPGGALHEGEAAVTGALREAAEEAGVPAGAVTPLATHVLDREVWRYTTLVARTVTVFDAAPTDAESIEIAWVPVREVTGLALHPGLEAAWPLLRTLLAARPTLLVDAANVVGSVPDGWWRDRAGAASRLGARLAALDGVPAPLLGLPGDRAFASVCVVLEGQARAATMPPGLETVEAPNSGDDALVEEARRRHAAGEQVTAVTSDRGLRARLDAVGARVVGAGALLEALG